MILAPKAPRPSLWYRIVRACAIAFGLCALAALAGEATMLWMLESDRIEVPRVIGLDSVAATTLLQEVGLQPKVVAEEFSEKIPKGSVTAERPPHGSRVTLGSEVRLFVSRGTDLLAVPKLAGSTVAQATRALAEAGLDLGPVTFIHSDLHPKDIIMAQDPPQGATAARGTAVRVLQSLGPWDDQVAMPDLRGREALVAVNLLKELQVEARISFQPSPAKDRVIAQDPAPGAPVKPGVPVELVVGE
ncbi:MAG TPA: PASTA domain-containing protein [Candidatus Baltobacteraceae bacterium]|nr:PASTA domain-containing protein [Candidatus Baltobacteraceae bacterium]